MLNLALTTKMTLCLRCNTSISVIKGFNLKLFWGMLYGLRTKTIKTTQTKKVGCCILKVIKFLKVTLYTPKYFQTSDRLMYPSKLLFKSQDTNPKYIETGRKEKKKKERKS